MKINGVNTVSLGEVLEYEQPTKYIVDDTNYDDEFDIPVLTAGKSFLLGYTNETHNVFSNVPVIIFDDFTTAFKYVDFPFKVKSSAMKILKANKEVADIRFLYYRMMKTGIDTELHKRYWISKYSKVKIPLPPLDQQKKIAAILDAADAYRQKTKALLKKYDELTQSLFLDMFGDPVKNPMGWDKLALNELCDFKKTSVKPEEIKTGDTYIGLECIEKQTGKILERFIVEAGEIKSNKFWFDSNYILYGKLRPYLNKVANPDFEGVCSTDIIPIRPVLKNTAKEFIISLLRGSWFVSFADERCSGANLPRISPKEVEKYQTINPPVKLQNQFAERVKAIEAQKAQAQASLAQAEDLFKSLLQRAFKGELTDNTSPVIDAF
jgi:type I restriction enzyme S subunit